MSVWFNVNIIIFLFTALVHWDGSLGLRRHPCAVWEQECIRSHSLQHSEGGRNAVHSFFTLFIFVILLNTEVCQLPWRSAPTRTKRARRYRQAFIHTERGRRKEVT
ncbi:hypothetical protein B0T21DRAFT_147296 [Apiosordaria backusii]|uniref:Uncharacterized protein n=1 Tax=Apiosordaria backusii TaxID=314023 RepID=A0AA40BSV6_9PEZI|nr:hypothetical protein B0T21DRAFT_147296 [Apiosordaria backusii]